MYSANECLVNYAKQSLDNSAVSGQLCKAICDKLCKTVSRFSFTARPVFSCAKRSIANSVNESRYFYKAVSGKLRRTVARFSFTA